MSELHKLRSRFVETVTTPGLHSDGGGLYLSVETTKSGGVSRRWVFKGRIERKVRGPLALGSARDRDGDYLTLAQARDVADKIRKLAANGTDPRPLIQLIASAIRDDQDPDAALAKKSEPEPAPFFDDYTRDFIRLQTGGWKSPKTGPQWQASLEQWAFPEINRGKRRRLDEIETADVLRVMRQEVGGVPFWQARPETASRVRNRIEAILDAAKAEGKIASPWENPARWRGNLKHLLPRRKKLTRGHHAALPYADAPAFMARLRDRGGVGALALEFCVLTATRTSEVRGATWAEFHLEDKTWTIPGERMKAGREHRVPLSARAIEILEELRDLGSPELVFPGTKKGLPISSGTLERVLDRMGAAVTVHGFRSSFRDWAAETTGFPGEVVEMALAHVVTNRVEAAYRRGDLFEKRRKLMDAWANYCARGANVIALKKRA